MSGGARHYTILFAEDEAPVRAMFGQVFATNGFTVLTATNGAEALELAARHPGPIDLLVSDVQMPGMTGPELARALRATRPGMRVLLVSGYTDGVLLMDNGWAFLQKPVLPQAILAKIREVLEHPPSPDVHKGTKPGL